MGAGGWGDAASAHVDSPAHTQTARPNPRMVKRTSLGLRFPLSRLMFSQSSRWNWQRADRIPPPAYLLQLLPCPRSVVQLSL